MGQAIGMIIGCAIGLLIVFKIPITYKGKTQSIIDWTWELS